MKLFWILAPCLRGVYSDQFAHSRPPLANAPDVSSTATCFATVAMSLFAALAAALISPLPAPSGPALVLMRAPGVLMLLVFPPGASGALRYDSPFPPCARVWGAPEEAGSTDSSVEHASLQLFFGPPSSVLTIGSA